MVPQRPRVRRQGHRPVRRSLRGGRLRRPGPLARRCEELPGARHRARPVPPQHVPGRRTHPRHRRGGARGLPVRRRTRARQRAPRLPVDVLVHAVHAQRKPGGPAPLRRALRAACGRARRTRCNLLRRRAQGDSRAVRALPAQERDPGQGDHGRGGRVPHDGGLFVLSKWARRPERTGSLSNIGNPPCDVGVIRSHKADAPCAPTSGPWVLAATIIGSAMAFIDSTVTNVALPQIQVRLGATATDAQWIVESYALFLSALILVGGSLGDHYGRRRIFSLGVAIFTLASVWCGLSTSPDMLIAARAVQGVGGALLVPGSLAIISASFEGEERGKAIGTWAGLSGVTTALGPILGGFLVENVSWRAAFLINVPLAIAVLLIAYRHVPESRDPDARKLDIPGAALATLRLGGVVYGLITSAGAGFDSIRVIVALVLGVGCIVGFVVWEQRREEPMLPLSMFRSRDFSGANVLTLLLYAGLGGALYFLPFLLIQVHGYTATAAGSSFLPFTIITFLMSRWAGGLITRYGARLPLMIGPVVAAAGFVLFARPGRALLDRRPAL